MPQNQARRGTGPKIQFVTGKGGVGKSLVAAALANTQARQGLKVLLVEIGDTSYYKDFFGLERVGHQGAPIPELGFDLALWSGESCLREYVLHYLKVERVFRIFFENKIMRAFLSVAPGLNEISILGKVTSGIRKIGPVLDYDVVVVDCYATGHALALFKAPKGLREAIGFGPMGTQSRDIENVLRNPDICQYFVVTLLEEMPVVETLEFRAQLRETLDVKAQVIANKILAPPVSEKDLERITKAQPEGLGEFATYLQAMWKMQQAYVAQLRREAGEILEIPLTFSNESRDLVVAAGEALRQA